MTEYIKPVPLLYYDSIFFCKTYGNPYRNVPKRAENCGIKKNVSEYYFCGGNYHFNELIFMKIRATNKKQPTKP